MPVIGTDIDEAVRVLRSGGLVALPTETVYGLAADAQNSKAVAAVYRIKQRPFTHPLIMHVADVAAVWQWAAAVPVAAQKLAARFMPGALSLLLPRAPCVPDAICGGSNYVALRVPAHPLAQRLLAAFSSALVAPSANRFGSVSPTTAAHVAGEFANEELLYVLDGGNCQIGIESTIVGFVNNEPYIARPGDIDAATIAATTGLALVSPPSELRVSGNLARHYAPRKIAQLVTSDAIDAELDSGVPAGVISRRHPHSAAAWRQAEESPLFYAHYLYRYLRELDSSPAVHRILIESPPDTADWAAINDRLKRACTQ